MCWTLKSDLQLTLIWLLSDLAGNLWRQHSNGAFATLSGFIVRLCCGAQNCPRQVGESSPASPAAPSRFSFIKKQQHPLGSHGFLSIKDVFCLRFNTDFRDAHFPSRSVSVEVSHFISPLLRIWRVQRCCFCLNRRLFLLLVNAAALTRDCVNVNLRDDIKKISDNINVWLRHWSVRWLLTEVIFRIINELEVPFMHCLICVEV